MIESGICEAIRLLTFEGSRAEGLSLGMVSVTGRDTMASVKYSLVGEVLLNAAEHVARGDSFVLQVVHKSSVLELYKQGYLKV